MALSDEQKKRVAYLAGDEWVILDEDDEDEDEEASRLAFDSAMKAIESDEELRAFAEEFNWDGGCDPMIRVVEHPLCDRGTALLIYWSAKPGWYVQFPKSKKLTEDEAEVFQLLSTIQERMLRGGFRDSTLSYDPRNDKGTDLTDVYPELASKAAGLKSPLLVIPALMYEPVAGLDGSGERLGPGQPYVGLR